MRNSVSIPGLAVNPFFVLFQPTVAVWAFLQRLYLESTSTTFLGSTWASVSAPALHSWAAVLKIVNDDY